MTCPDCKTSVQSDMKYCPVCGSVLIHCIPVSSAPPSGICLKWFDSFMRNGKMMNYAWEEKNKLLLLIPILIGLFVISLRFSLFFFIARLGVSLRCFHLLSPFFDLIPTLFFVYSVCYGVKKYHENNEKGFRIAIFFLILIVLAGMLSSLLIAFSPYSYYS